MTTPDADPDMMAAEFALGLLEGDERAEALRRAVAEPAFARDVEVWRAHFAVLFAEWPEVAAPDLTARLAAATAPRAANDNGLWKAAAGVATLVAASLLGVLVTRPAPAPVVVAAAPARPLLAALARTDGKPALPAIYDADAKELRVAMAALADAGKSAELWAIGGDGVPHALGLLAEGAATRIALPAAERAMIVTGATLAVSIEPAGGAPGAVPTGPVVASGALIQT